MSTTHENTDVHLAEISLIQFVVNPEDAHIYSETRLRVTFLYTK